MGARRHVNNWLLKRFLRLGTKMFDAVVLYAPNEADTWGIAFYDSKRVRDAVFTNRGDSKQPRVVGKVLKTESVKLYGRRLENIKG